MARIAAQTGSIYGDREGNVVLEFALIVPVLMFLIIGIYEFGRFYWIQNTLQFAAEQAARCIMANTGYNASDLSSGTCAISNYLAGIAPTSAALTSPSCSGVNGSISPAPTCKKIVVTYDFSFVSLMARFSGGTITITGQSTVPTS